MRFPDAVHKARQGDDFQALLDSVPYARYLGVSMERQAEGLVFHLPFQEKTIGNHLLPALHGGVIAGFMEHSALLHLMVEQAQNRLPKTVDFSLDYLRSAGPKDTHARCEVTRQGRRVAHVQIICWQDNPEKPVATARVHFVLEEMSEGDGANANPLQAG